MLHKQEKLTLSLLGFIFNFATDCTFAGTSTVLLVRVRAMRALVQAGLQIRAYGRIREFPREFFSKLRGIFCILNHFPPSK